MAHKLWVSVGIFHIQAEHRGPGDPWIPFLNTTGTNRSNTFLSKSETDRSIACSALMDSVQVDRLISRLPRVGWFTAYLANVFLTKLQGPILARQSRVRTNPNHTF